MKELPVYKVQKRSEKGKSKSRTLHRSLIFPLLQKECDSQGELGVEVTGMQPEEEYWLADEVATYEGPTARSRSKRQALTKANLLLSDHFDNHKTHPGPLTMGTRIWRRLESLLRWIE